MEMEMEKSWEEVPGHLAPSTIFVGVGIFVLVKTLQLTKDLPPGRTFPDVHLPFGDLGLIRNISYGVMGLTVAGMLYHAAGEGIDPQLELHMVLYSVFFMVGLIAFLESAQRLPPDSGRVGLSLGLLLEGCIWVSHGVAMDDPVPHAIHIYLGYTNIINGIAFAYSVMHTDSMLAHIVSWGLMIAHGIWFYLVSFQLCCIDMERTMLEPYLCLVGVGVTLIIVLVIAAADLPQVRKSHLRHVSQESDYREEYDVLLTTKMEHNDDGKHDIIGCDTDTTFESQDSCSI